MNASQQTNQAAFYNQLAAVENQQTREKPANFVDSSKMVPPFKDYMNNLHTYQYLQQLEQAEVPQQPRHCEITQQNSSSTDEGCETDHGGELDLFLLPINE